MTEVESPRRRRGSGTARLSRELDEHAYRYYVLDAPTVSDGDYDALLRELRGARGRSTPACARPDSPTQRVGGDATPPLFTAVEHPERMLSLDNVFSAEELRGLGGPGRARRARAGSAGCASSRSTGSRST